MIIKNYDDYAKLVRGMILSFDALVDDFTVYNMISIRGERQASLTATDPSGTYVSFTHTLTEGWTYNGRSLGKMSIKTQQEAA